MKKVFLMSVALAGMMAGLWAQEGPGAPGSETVARPRQKAAPAPEPPVATPGAPVPVEPRNDSKIASKLMRPKNEGAGVTFASNASEVTVDIAVIDNSGRFIPGIGKENFRILEDNVPQNTTGFNVGQAPITVSMVIEFSNMYQWYGSSGWAQTLQAAYGFASTLQKDDYLAIIRYDLRTQIVSDFTNDRGTIQEALRSLRIPDFREANMFDALTDTADRMSKIEGRKAVLVLTSGIDTLSHQTYDEARRKLQDSGVPIYSISLLQMERAMVQGSGGIDGAMQDLSFMQADNQLRTFAKDTGGQAFFPRFPADVMNSFQLIANAMRSQYTVTYHPSNTVKDGKFRKITVQLIDPQTGQPLKAVDEKGKVVKYTVVARSGYKAPHEVE